MVLMLIRWIFQRSIGSIWACWWKELQDDCDGNTYGQWVYGRWVYGSWLLLSQTLIFGFKILKKGIRNTASNLSHRGTSCSESLRHYQI